MKVAELIYRLNTFPPDMEVAVLDDSEPMIVGSVCGVVCPESTGMVCIAYVPDDRLDDKWP